MCLISYAPEGKDKYSEEFINAVKNGATNNKDGYGYMYWLPDGNKIYFNKKFLSIDNLLIELKEKNLPIESKLAIHSRTGNKGLKDTFNAHPFTVSDEISDLYEIEGSTQKPTLVHNGTFFISGNTNIHSDTYNFIKGFLSVPEITGLLKRDKQKFMEIFDVKMGTNKLVVFYPDGQSVVIGNFLEDNGYFHSNICYKDIKVKDVGGTTTEQTNLFNKNNSTIPTSLNSSRVTKNNEYGINVNNFTKNDIYFECTEQHYSCSPGSFYIVCPKEDIGNDNRTIKFLKVTKNELEQIKETGKSPFFTSVHYVYPEDIYKKFIIRSREQYNAKFLNYVLVVNAIGKLSGKRSKKILQAYNSSKASSSEVILKVENKVYHLNKDAYQLYLFENFSYLKWANDYRMGTLEKDYQAWTDKNKIIPIILPQTTASDDYGDDYAYMGMGY